MSEDRAAEIIARAICAARLARNEPGMVEDLPPNWRERVNASWHVHLREARIALRALRKAGL